MPAPTEPGSLRTALARSAPARLLFLALLADAVHLKRMAAGLVMMFLPDLFFHSFDLWRKELD